jgi:AraC-like DNA-binding protein
MRLKYIVSGMATHTPGAALAQRTMWDYEFVWMIRGNAQWLVSGEEKPFLPGSVILSQPGLLEGYRWDPEAPTRHAYFHFDVTGPLPKELPPQDKWPQLRAMPEGDVVRPLFNYVLANTQGADVSREPGPAVTAAVETMLTAFVLGPLATEGEGISDVPEPVHRSIQFVAQTLSKRPSASITLEQMAEAGSVTSKHLCRLFKEHVDITPMGAVLALRLRHAVALMARTDFKLERIAHECGFATSFHFSRRFRDMYGKPPSEVRADLAAGRYQPPARFHWGNKLTIEYPI